MDPAGIKRRPSKTPANAPDDRTEPPIPAKRDRTPTGSCVAAGQEQLLLQYEKNVRAVCGIKLSSDYVLSVPRIPRYRLDPIVQSNIARLQNAQRPLVRAANKRLQQIVRGISGIAVEARPEPTGYNPFKRWSSGTNGPCRDLFTATPARPSTISVEQYRQGIRTNRSNAEGSRSEVESSDSEETNLNAPPSAIVPIKDLNVDAVDLPRSIETLFGSLSDSPGYDSLVLNSCSAQLPNQLLESDSGGESPGLNIGLDTEDELLRSDTEEPSPNFGSLNVSLSLQRIDIDRVLGTKPLGPAPKEPADTQRSRSPEQSTSPNRESSVSSLSTGPISLESASDLSDWTDAEDTGKSTPKRPAQRMSVLRLPANSKKRRRLNISLRSRAINAIRRYRIRLRNPSALDRLEIRYADVVEQELVARHGL